MGYEVECYGKITTRELELREINKLFSALGGERLNYVEAFGGCIEVSKKVKGNKATIIFEIGYFGKIWEEDIHQFFAIINPYIKSGLIEYEGEDKVVWRDEYRNGKWYQDKGKIKIIYTESTTPITLPEYNDEYDDEEDNVDLDDISDFYEIKD